MAKRGQRAEQPSSASTLEKGIRILGIEYGLTSSSGYMLDNPDYFSRGEIFSQLTNWESIEEIDYVPGMHAYLHLEDVAGVRPRIDLSKNTLRIEGDLVRLEEEIQDRRWAILGNQGIWFRFALAVQERHGIFAFHAASIYNPESNHLVILAGKAGAGKTVYLLSSISTGWRIFSTEMTYFSLTESGLSLYRGSLIDNIFVGSLTLDFPEARSHLEVEIPVEQDPWAHKVCVDMHMVAVDQPVLTNPTISFLFPHVERGLDCTDVHDIEDFRILRRRLFENASEKIGASLLLHEQLPATGFDNQELARSRLKAIERMLQADPWIIQSARVVSSGPTLCLEGLPL